MPVSLTPAGHRQPVSRQTRRPVQPGWVRAWHWINVLAVLIMVTSGWRIYNASPLFDFRFDDVLTLGGWLGGALQWHFAGMWLLFVNGLFYLVANVATGRLRTRFFPITVSALVKDTSAALHGRLTHADPRHYNSIQKVAYLFAILDIAVLIASGLALWKPVQFALLSTLFGGYEFTRLVHFFSMAALLVFVLVHVLMVIVVPRTLLTMIRGR